MNQAIQFPDQQTWSEEKQQIEFPALVMGQLIVCRVSKASLLRLAIVEQGEAMTLFSELRFDLEEMAEEKINAEDFAPDGGIFI
ncbi:DUF1488 domain-containing protein [Motilimonas pumila]|uniref:DUF1488 domain-containing protein n=1 Tax=Motilimonas pumila TaxID=2303987 RepID=A0A418YJ43_9GAMM|nr:DUF1488 domain-containing protein [Motilimonas pumila]RJG50671.1 DUF1488 domain-containing protein [Motilimonas pumila]